MPITITGTGPTTLRTMAFPDANATILTTANAVTAAQGGTGFSSYTTGDITYASGATTLAKLAAGAAGTVLVGGATPSYSATPSVTSLTASTSITLGSSPALSGTFNLGNNQYLKWRNAANNADSAYMVYYTDNVIYLSSAGGFMWQLNAANLMGIDSVSLFPGSNDTLNLGGSSARWKGLYANRINSSLATPSSLADGDWWVEATGTSPSRVAAIKVRDGGVTRTIASITY